MATLKPILGTQLRQGHPLAPNLGCWLFNEGDGNIVSDLSGNRYDGTITNAVWAGGNSGPAMVCDGTEDYVDTSSDVTRGTYSELTVVCSFMASTLQKAVLVGKFSGAGGNGEFAAGCWDANGVFRWYMSNVTKRWISNAGFLVADEWVQVVGVYNGLLANANKIRVYKNGVLETPASLDAVGASHTSDSTVFKIGKDNHFASLGWSEWPGSISYVMVYDTAFTAQQAAQIYQEPFAAFVPQPIDLWTAAASVSVPAGTVVPQAYWLMRNTIS